MTTAKNLISEEMNNWRIPRVCPSCGNKTIVSETGTLIEKTFYNGKLVSISRAPSPREVWCFRKDGDGCHISEFFCSKCRKMHERTNNCDGTPKQKPIIWRGV